MKLVINGKEVSTDVSPQIIDGRTMVPNRVISESLGAKVQYDETTKTVTVVKESGDTVSTGNENDQSYLVGVGGNEYVEGQYPIHWAYDLNGVRKFINGSPEGSKIRSQFDEMVRNAIYFQYDFKRAGKLTTDEWDSVDKDIEMKLNTLVEIGKDVENNELDQAIELFTKFLNEAQESQDYMRYMTVVEGMETLYNYLKE